MCIRALKNICYYDEVIYGNSLKWNSWSPGLRIEPLDWQESHQWFPMSHHGTWHSGGTIISFIKQIFLKKLSDKWERMEIKTPWEQWRPGKASLGQQHLRYNKHVSIKWRKNELAASLVAVQGQAHLGDLSYSLVFPKQCWRART